MNTLSVIVVVPANIYDAIMFNGSYTIDSTTCDLYGGFGDTPYKALEEKYNFNTESYFWGSIINRRGAIYGSCTSNPDSVGLELKIPLNCVYGIGTMGANDNCFFLRVQTKPEEKYDYDFFQTKYAYYTLFKTIKKEWIKDQYRVQVLDLSGAELRTIESPEFIMPLRYYHKIAASAKSKWLESVEEYQRTTIEARNKYETFKEVYATSNKNVPLDSLN